MKKFTAILLAGIMIFSISGTCMAKEVIFQKKFVDSNTWCSICTGTKDTTTSTTDLKINNIYKSDGSSSAYRKVKAKIAGGSSTTAVKGSYVKVTVPSSKRAKGSVVSLQAMGNNPRLDCKISGYWVIY